MVTISGCNVHRCLGTPVTAGAGRSRQHTCNLFARSPGPFTRYSRAQCTNVFAGHSYVSRVFNPSGAVWVLHVMHVYGSIERLVV
jgi:hypothetical protein